MMRDKKNQLWLIYNCQSTILLKSCILLNWDFHMDGYSFWKSMHYSDVWKWRHIGVVQLQSSSLHSSIHVDATACFSFICDKLQYACMKRSFWKLYVIQIDLLISVYYCIKQKITICAFFLLLFFIWLVHAILWACITEYCLVLRRWHCTMATLYWHSPTEV